MEEIGSSKLFGWVDYLLFAVVLVLTALIGIFYAWRAKSRPESDYLTGGKQLGVFPIAMSLAAGTLSATALLATPTDIYLTGTMHWWIVIASILSIPVIVYLYLPVFHELQVVSANQYLEMRFHQLVRRISTSIFVIIELFYLSIVVYGPSLALNQMTGIDVYILVGVTFVLCTFYTSVGGIQAVVWTDTLQIFLVYGSILTVLIKGIVDVGGIAVVWERSLNSSRIEFFNIDPDITTRQTVWSTVIGGVFFWVANQAVHQTAVQRFNAVKTIRQAGLVMILNSFALVTVISLCCLLGLVVYARYYDCDPITAKMIDKPDQIIPYFVMDTVGHLPGLPGIFVAGVFSGALSALSSGMNSVALVVLEDFIRPFRPHMTDQMAVRVTKLMAVGVGVVCFAFVFLVANVQTILDATLSLSGAYGGALLGVFTLGMCVPHANAIGAGIGMASSFILMMALGLASQVAKSQGFVHNQVKSFDTFNCPAAALLSNTTSSEESNQETAAAAVDISFLLRISYLWYTLMGFLIALVVGSLVSLVTQPQDPSKLDGRLVWPFLRSRVGLKRSSTESCETPKSMELS